MPTDVAVDVTMGGDTQDTVFLSINVTATYVFPKKHCNSGRFKILAPKSVTTVEPSSGPLLG